MHIDPRFTGQGGMPYDSPEGRAYRNALTIRMNEAGHDKPTEVYALASRLLWESECDFPQDRTPEGHLSHAECACPDAQVAMYRSHFS